MTKKKAAVKKEPGTTQETPKKKKRSFFKTAVLILAAFFLIPVGINGVKFIGGCAVKYYKYMLCPDKIIPDILPDFHKEDDGGKRQRRRGIIDRKDRGIDWNFSAGSKSFGRVKKFVADSVPAGASKETLGGLRDSFYAAADAIYDGETTTAGRSLAFLKKQILLNADESWEDFFKGLTDVVAGESVSNLNDVADLYEDIGDAFDAKANGG